MNCGFCGFSENNPELDLLCKACGQEEWSNYIPYSGDPEGLYIDELVKFLQIEKRDRQPWLDEEYE
jgi:hypothetical protein